MRKKDEAGRAPSALGWGALVALWLVLGCLNPRPEELPSSSADPAQPSVDLGEPNPGGQEPSARAGRPEAAGAAGIDGAEDAPSEAATPALAPEPPPAPAGGALPDAGADAATADPDAG